MCRTRMHRRRHTTLSIGVCREALDRSCKELPEGTAKALAQFKGLSSSANPLSSSEGRFTLETPEM